MDGGTFTDEAAFHPELAALLDDPITHHVMASDRVEMATLVALLRTVRRQLKQQAKREACAPDHRSRQ